MANKTFQRGTGCYTCEICKKKTRDTGYGEAYSGLCRCCWEKAGDENTISDHAEKVENIVGFLISYKGDEPDGWCCTEKDLRDAKAIYTMDRLTNEEKFEAARKVDEANAAKAANVTDADAEPKADSFPCEIVEFDAATIAHADAVAAAADLVRKLRYLAADANPDRTARDAAKADLELILG